MKQKEALEILKLGYNVFLTGPAGSGKTYVLNQYIKYLQPHKVQVGVTASTGIAATHMGGTTIHSWAGMGVRDSITQKDLDDLFKRQYLRKRFQKAQVLIIDEISMLHGYRLDMVDMICRAFKKNSAPFGGMQIVMCGDFFQLPPVQKFKKNSSPLPSSTPPQGEEISPIHEELLNQDSLAPLRERGSERRESDFVYNSQVWNKMNLKICYLDEQYRQEDRNFLKVLNAIRNSEVDEMTVEYLQERLNKPIEGGYSRPTRLFSHNVDVDVLNQKHLELLSSEGKEFFMNSRGNSALIDILRNSCLAPQRLVLKVGVQVMFVKNNYEAGYVNGTLGEVIAFDKEGHPVVRTFDGNEIPVLYSSWEIKEEDKELASIAQIPLRLAWAITVHKSQGMSLDAAEIDLSKSFVPGMGYVALSRVRSLDGLKLLGFNQMALTVNPEVAEIDRNFILSSHENSLELAKMSITKKQQMQKDFLDYIKPANFPQ